MCEQNKQVKMSKLGLQQSTLCYEIDKTNTIKHTMHTSTFVHGALKHTARVVQ